MSLTSGTLLYGGQKILHKKLGTFIVIIAPRWSLLYIHVSSQPKRIGEISFQTAKIKNVLFQVHNMQKISNQLWLGKA